MTKSTKTNGLSRLSYIFVLPLYIIKNYYGIEFFIGSGEIIQTYTELHIYIFSSKLA